VQQLSILIYASKTDSYIPQYYLIVLAKELYFLKDTEDLKFLIQVQEAIINFSGYKLAS